MESRLVAIAMIGGQCWLMWHATGQLMTSLLMFGGFIAATFLPKKIPAPVCWGVWGVFTLIAFVRNLFLYDLHSGAGVILPIWITVTVAESLLVLQSGLALHRPAGARFSSWLPPVGAICLACIYNQSVSYDQQKLYFIASIFQFAALAYLWRQRTATRNESSAHTFYTGVMLFAALAVGWGLVDGWTWSVPRARNWLSLNLAVQRNRGTEVSNSYVRSGSLFAVSAAQQTNPNHVALRVHAETTPGYLRGRAFDTYYNGSWHRLRREFSSYHGPTTSHPFAAQRGERVFALDHQGQAPWTEMMIRNDPDRRAMFFLPPGASYLRGRGNAVEIDYHGTVRAGLSNDEPYYAYVGRTSTTQAPSRELQAILLNPPVRDRQVRDLAAEICRNCTTTREKVTAVEQHFLQNYTYSLQGADRPASSRPLVDFVLNRPPAHCEFFASGSIALLRFQGVPCRYVVGYIAAELEPEYGDYWIARNRDAHAWVEAWDAENQEWITVESTPGIVIPEAESLSARHAGASGAAGSVSSLLGESWTSVATLLQTIFTSPKFVWILFGVAAQAILIAYLFKVRAQRAREEGAAHRHNAALLRTVERKLARRKLPRGPAETLHAFARRLRRAAQEDPWILAAAQWCETYADQAYNPLTAEQPMPPLRA